MKSKRHIRYGAGVGTLILALAWAGMTAADTITLHEEAYVQGPKVLLGDIADIQSDRQQDLARIELASAALPGEIRRLDAALVMARVKSSGIACDALQFQGAKSVSATTLSQLVTADLVTESLRAFIEANMPWDPATAEVEVAAFSGEFSIPEGGVQITWRPSPQYRYVGGGAFRGQVTVDGQIVKSITCQASVTAYSPVVIAKRDIARGTVISREALDIQIQPVNASNPLGAVTDPEEIAGLVARTTIYPGQVINARQVTQRTLVRRNQVVAIETHAGSLVVQGRARAMNDACAGDTLVCLNPETKAEIQGIVRADGVVVVP